MSDTDQHATIAGTRRYRLRSDHVGETFQIDVALPANEPSDGQPMPVVYVTDANTVFGIAAQALRFLQQADGAAPALLVGVGYCLDGVVRPRDAYGALRVRDLTPSRDDGFVERLLQARGGRPYPDDIALGGGADAFLAFLVEELAPFIADRYRVDPGDQALIGSSLGGLFNLHALFTRPGVFRRHGAMSPSLWWNGGEPIAQEAAFAGAARDLPVDLFLSVGGEETNPQWPMRSQIETFARTMAGRGYPSLRLTSHVFEGETHTSVIPAALSRCLRTLLTAAGTRSATSDS